MNIYEQLEEEVNIVNQKEALERKIYIQELKLKEAKLLESFNDMGLKYSKCPRYILDESVGGRVNILYTVKLYPKELTRRTSFGNYETYYEMKDVAVSERGFTIGSRKDSKSIYHDDKAVDFDTFINKLKHAIRYVIKHKVAK